MHLFDTATLQQRLTYPALVAALREVMRREQTGRTIAPQRTVVALPDDATLLLMPASDGELLITKFVTVYPHSAPSVRADVLACNARTGERLALLDGEIITTRRTAALSLLAAQTLAAVPDGPLLIIGAGAQGQAHLEAFTCDQPQRQVYITSRTPASAQHVADQARQRGLKVQAIADGATVLDAATLIVTATTSITPVFADRVRPDVFIAAVGAFRPHMAEVPAALVQRSALYVDTWVGAQAEAGDLLQANIDWAQVTPLGAAFDQPPPRGRPVLFKSVGHALWDLAAVRTALEM